MNIEELLRREEGKTLEFKRDLSSPQKLQIMEIRRRPATEGLWRDKSNPGPFSVWGKCGEKDFPHRDAENGT